MCDQMSQLNGNEPTPSTEMDQYLEQMKQEGWVITHNGDGTVTMSADLIDRPDGIGLMPRKA